MIVRTPENGNLENVRGVGGHAPRWAARAPGHVLACSKCTRSWPCQKALSVADVLDNLKYADGLWGPQREHLEALNRGRAAELRGEVAGWR